MLESTACPMSEKKGQSPCLTLKGLQEVVLHSTVQLDLQ